MQPRICVIFNPAARGEKARRFRAGLAQLQGQCACKPTLAAGHARALAAEAVREGYELIVAAGGDGTVNEVVNGLGDVPDGFTRATLGVLPLGTINVFAREHGLSLSFKAAWEVLQGGREFVMDLGLADFTLNGKPERRYFAQMAGAGLDARAIELVNWSMKKKTGAFAYILAGCRALRGRLPLIRVRAGDQALGGELVTIGNGRFYGGSFRLFPHADLRDGLLEVTVLPRAGIGSLLRGFCGVLCNRVYTLGGARYLQARQVQLTSDEPALFHVEGEKVGQLPATFSVSEKKLRVRIK